MPDRGIGRDAGKSIGAAALQTYGELAERSGFSGKTIGFHQAFEGGANGIGKHGRFKTGLLLFKHQNRLVQGRVPLAKRVHQNGRLGILATETQHRRAGNVGMMDVTGEQATERFGILTGAPTAAFMHQEPYSVDIGKDPLLST